ncbi:dynein light chain type 1-domain-containing protein [Leucosporidium creatinivorum]|uniref:Dynein light chain n=1 Tax=Leucosporidium creatinivorum TaxID=106004 RepID=A0A1Y2E2T0_9BASI|nr:dynein light chain type 1-domain-containing protein [Leucosporidium creatinivorum]
MSEKQEIPSTPPQAIVKSADMPEEMQAGAIEIAIEAQDKHEIEKDIAAQIKKEADKRWGPTWHVVVGKSFGSYVTHTSGNFIYMYINQLAFLVFKAG